MLKAVTRNLLLGGGEDTVLGGTDKLISTRYTVILPYNRKIIKNFIQILTIQLIVIIQMYTKICFIIIIENKFK